MKKINFEHMGSNFKIVTPIEMSKIVGGGLTPGVDAPGCYWNPAAGGPLENFYWDGTYPLDGDFVCEQDPKLC